MDQDNTVNQSRRRFLKIMASAGVAGLILTSGAEIVMTAPQKENSIEDLTFEPMWGEPSTPLTSNGEVYSLTDNNFISPDQIQETTLLLSSRAAFPQWRDSTVTPDFLGTNTLFQSVIDDTEAKLTSWETTIEKILKNNQYALTTDFNPDSLFKTLQIAKSIAENLTYSRYTPELLSALSLDQRIELGATNCLEYSLLTSSALALFGIPTEIIHFGLNKNGSNSSHVATVINVSDTCVVVDAAIIQDRVMTFRQYLKSLNKKNIYITSPIKYTSILTEQNLDHFKWNDKNWIDGKAVPSLTNAIGKLTSTQKNINPHTTAIQR